MKPLSFKRHRFPPEIIRHAIWLYGRFTLSFRDVRHTLLQDVQLMTQDQDFGFQVRPRLEPAAQRAEEQEADRDRLAIMFRFTPTRESVGWTFRKRHRPTLATEVGAVRLKLNFLGS